jgi:hypothetical protein
MALLALAIGAGTAYAVVLDNKAFLVSSVAKRLETGTPLGASSVRRVEQISLAEISCRRDLRNYLLSTHLASLDWHLTSPQSAGPQILYPLAKQQALQTVQCFPLNGNAWMRLAMMQLRLEGPGEDVLNYLKASQAITPHEGYIIETRLPVLLSLAQLPKTSTLAQDIDTMLTRDIETWLRHAHRNDIRQLWRNLGPFGRHVIYAKRPMNSVTERGQWLEGLFATRNNTTGSN